MREIITLIATALLVAAGLIACAHMHSQTKPIKISMKNNQKLNNTRKALLYRYLKK